MPEPLPRRAGEAVCRWPLLAAVLLADKQLATPEAAGAFLVHYAGLKPDQRRQLPKTRRFIAQTIGRRHHHPEAVQRAQQDVHHYLKGKLG